MIAPARGVAYFLDLDGTLVEFADHPARIRPRGALPRLIDTLSRSSGGALAIITGRPLTDVDRLFPGLQLPAAGQHGLERRAVDGQVRRHRANGRALDAARRALAEAARRHAGLIVEDKGLSLALHYRRVPRLAGLAHRVMRAAHGAIGPQYCLQRGKRVIELAPAGRDKGKAIGAFMREQPFRGRTPVFIGDDVTDEFGFVMVNRLGGYSIKVGSGHTAAGWRLPNVRAVLQWLEHGKPAPRKSTRGRRPSS